MRFLLDDADYRYSEETLRKNILHVVLTRFNMKLPSFRQVGDIKDEEQFAEWLSHRSKMFQAICLPSLTKQSRVPDAWVIGFDEDYRKQVAPIIQLISRYQWIRPMWQKCINGVPENARSLFIREVTSLLRPEHEYVVTSRVDNDDAVSRGYSEANCQFVAAVVAKTEGPKDFWVSFPFGSQLSSKALRVLPQNNNAFLSRCEPATQFRAGKGNTALTGNHGHVFEKGKVYTPMSRSPMWLQCVHEGNVSNTENRTLPVLAERTVELRRFGIDERMLVELALAEVPSESSSDPEEFPASVQPASLAEPQGQLGGSLTISQPLPRDVAVDVTQTLITTQEKAKPPMYITPLSRVNLLSLLPANSRVAELGVNNGGFASAIWRYAKPAELHLVDPWGGDEDEYVKRYNVTENMEDKYQNILKMFSDGIAAKKIAVHRGYSTSIFKEFSDGFFDWIYIDALHTYEGVLQDLRDWDAKVSATGFIAGHDFSNTQMSRFKGFGIVRAVREFLQEHSKYSLLAITNESAPSWVIAKDPSAPQAVQFLADLVATNPAIVQVDLQMIDYFDQVEYNTKDGKRLQVIRFSSSPDTSTRRQITAK